MKRIIGFIIIFVSSYSFSWAQYFVENKGQFDNILGSDVEIKYKAKVNGVDAYITNSGLNFIYISSKTIKKKEDYNRKVSDVEKLNLKLKGVSISNSKIEAQEQNFFERYYLPNIEFGLKAKTYTDIIVKDVYPNIDWRLYFDKSENLKYDFIIHPGGDINNISIEYEGLDNLEFSLTNDKIHIRNNKIALTDGPIKAFYESTEKVDISYVLNKNSIKFKGKGIDETKKYIIDPPLKWGTFFGGSAHDGGRASFIDELGNKFVGGYTYSSVFPIQSSAGAYNQSNILIVPGVTRDKTAFITKFDIDGQKLWTTYFGGSINESVKSINGNSNRILVGGFTESRNDFPLMTQAGAFNSSNDALSFLSTFIIEFNAVGALQWSSLIKSNTSTSNFIDLKLDDAGNFYMLLTAEATDLPIVTPAGAYSQTHMGNEDLYLVRFDNNNALTWSSYFGSTDGEFAGPGSFGGPSKNGGMDVKGNSLVFGGSTQSQTGFPTVNPGGGAFFDGTFGVSSFGNPSQGFLAEIDLTNMSLIWCTYVNSTRTAFVTDVALNDNNELMISASSTLPSAPFHIMNLAGAYNNGGTANSNLLLFDTSRAQIYGASIDVDIRSVVEGNTGFYISAEASFSAGVPLVNNPSCYFQNYNDRGDAYFFKLDYSNYNMSWATFYGDESTQSTEDIYYSKLYDALLVVGETKFTQPIFGTIPDPSGPLVNNYGPTAFYDTTFNGANFDEDTYILFFEFDCDFDVSFLQGDSVVKCDNDSTQISVNPIPSATYHWNTGNTNDTLPFLFAQTAGEYIITVDSSGCLARDTIIVIDSICTIMPISINDSIFICNGDSAFLENDWQFTSGTYIDSIFNASVLDSIIITDLTVNSILIGDTSFASICNGDSFQLPDGMYVNIPTIYLDTVASGSPSTCDSLVIFNVSVFNATNSMITDSICISENYTFPSGTVVNTPGMYSDTISNSIGCDSIISITLLNKLNNYHFATPTTTTVCNNDLPVNIFGIAQNTAGTYFDTIINMMNCDSILTQTLSISNTQSDTTLFISICNGDSFQLPNGMYVNIPTIYLDTIPSNSTLTCDSVLTYDISVLNATSSMITDSICTSENYTFPSGTVVNTPGMYSDTIPNSIGCDSIISITLLNKLNNYHYAIPINTTACNNNLPVNIFGIAQNTAGTYFDTINNVVGCDSILTQILSISSTQSDTTSFITLCDGDSFLINGTYYSQSGSFLVDTTTGVTGCDVYNIVNIAVISNPNPMLGPDLSLEQGEDVFLEVQNAVSSENYSWSNSIGESYFGVIIQADNETSAEYYVVATNLLGNCFGYDTLNVTINQNDGVILFVPTGFSPNNDGFNDVFRVANYTDFETYSLKVFNRWGELVFDNSGKDVSWDGKYKGADQEIGSYVYHINARPVNGAEEISTSGNLTLIR